MFLTESCVSNAPTVGTRLYGSPAEVPQIDYVADAYKSGEANGYGRFPPNFLGDIRLDAATKTLTEHFSTSFHRKIQSEFSTKRARNVDLFFSQVCVGDLSRAGNSSHLKNRLRMLASFWDRIYGVEFRDALRGVVPALQRPLSTDGVTM